VASTYLEHEKERKKIKIKRTNILTHFVILCREKPPEFTLEKGYMYLLYKTNKMTL
jgi:hypothetical protein